LKYIITILILGFIIFVHEAGHYLMAKLTGIPIAKFSVGFGKKLWSKKSGNTEYMVSMIPLGGYVMPDVKSADEFHKIPPYKRAIFFIGGVTANILVAIISFAIFIIIKNGFTVNNIFIKPVVMSFRLLYKIIISIPQIFNNPQTLSGILGIVTEGGAFIGEGAINIFYLIIFLNLNLAVMNLLPIPGLDGGKLMILLLSKIYPKVEKVETYLSVAGFVLLLGVIVYVTALDIGRIIGMVG